MHIPSHVFETLFLLKPGLQMHSYDGCRLTQISDDEQLFVFVSKHSFTSVFTNTRTVMDNIVHGSSWIIITVRRTTDLGALQG